MCLVCVTCCAGYCVKSVSNRKHLNVTDNKWISHNSPKTPFKNQNKQLKKSELQDQLCASKNKRTFAHTGRKLCSLGVSKKKTSSSRTESTLTGKDVGVSVLLLVVVLVGLLIRPGGITPWQELQAKKQKPLRHYTILKKYQTGWHFSRSCQFVFCM